MVNKFISNVKALCSLGGIKVGEFEKELGLSKGYLARVSRGSGELSLKTALVIADKLGKSMDDLLTSDYGSEVTKRDLDEKIRKAREELARLEAERDEIG